MIVARDRETLRQHLSPAGPRVLVPTMGALHEGHLALVGRAREAAGAEGQVIVSIFVNPIQFDRPADLAAYPRPLEDDLAACRAAGVDLVFAPDADLHPPDRSVTVRERELAAGLCGAARPGHFDGVCTIVLKLFLLTRCDAAVFGEKDFQQLAVIRRMVRDLDVPVEILAHPTVREPDGLAMSSRNRRLDPAGRADAPRLHRALLAARQAAAAGEISSSALKAAARMELDGGRIDRIDYLELVDATNLRPLEVLDRPALLAIAAFYGEVRLIDHLTLEPSEKA